MFVQIEKAKISLMQQEIDAEIEKIEVMFVNR
jgi:hypothetical protein